MKIINQNPTQLQKNIFKELETIEQVLSKIATQLSGTYKEAEIYAMPNCSIPMYDFYDGNVNGIFIHWDTDVPFFPIDFKINLGEICIYRLNDYIHPLKFIECVENAIKEKQEKERHLIALLYSNGLECLQKGQYLLIQLSVDEYQQHNLREGLYVTPGNWFYDQIRVITDNSSKIRVRYIYGQKAERYYFITKKFHKYNSDRNDYLAKSILGELYDKKVLTSIYSGMPSINSIALNCNWKCKMYPMVNEKENAIYLVYPDWHKAFEIDGKKICLSPHNVIDSDITNSLESCKGEIIDKLFKMVEVYC